MEKERDSRIELLRLLLIVTVPIYHVVSYVGCFYTEYPLRQPLSYVLWSEGAVAADYAFITISSYFLITQEKRPVIRRLLSTIGMVIYVLVIKTIVLHFALRGEQVAGTLLEDFFVKGAWWFIWAYLVLFALHPVLSYLSRRMTKKQQMIFLLLLGMLLLVINYFYHSNLVCDVVAFIFTYEMTFLIVRCKENWQSAKPIMAGIVFTLVIFFLIIGIATIIEYSGWIVDTGEAYQIILRICGKYSLLQIFLGMSYFWLAYQAPKRYSKTVNALAGYVIYIFLIHETVLCVFWQTGIIDHTLRYAGKPIFYGYALLALAVSVATGILIGKIYERFVGRLWGRAVDAICNVSGVRRMEAWLQSLMRES